MFEEFLKFKKIEGFRSGDVPEEEWIHVTFHDGGLGDHVCRLSAIKYIVEQYPHVNLTVWCPKFFVEFAKKAVPKANWQPYKDNILTSMSRPLISAGSNAGVSSMGMHLVDHAFATIVDRQVSIEHKNYVQVDNSNVDLSKFNLPKPYVVVTTGYTAKVRELIPSVVNEIVAYIKSRNYNVVFLGNRNAVIGSKAKPIQGQFSNEINYSEGLDLRDKTSLIEAQAIIAQSKTIVGLDNGLLHLAGTSNIPIVFGFTTVLPEHRVPYRNNQLGWNTYVVTPPESLSCRGCQSKMNFVYDDFRFCRYKDYKCTKEADSSPYIEHLKDIL